MNDLRRFAATLLFWGCFAAAECAVIVPLAGALGGQGEGAALALVLILIGCLVGGAVFAVPRYNAMMKAMDRQCAILRRNSTHARFSDNPVA